MGTYAKVKGKLLRKIMEQPASAVISHWLFQSLLYMDVTERWFKISLDIVFTLLMGLVLSIYFQGVIPWVIAFLFAHTMNFLFNGQLWGVLKHYGMIQVSRDNFQAYVHSFRQRARDEKAIEKVLVFGSLARGEWKEGSDFDARIIHKPGLENGLRSCTFLLKERARALFQMFPLDVYVLDGESSSQKMKMMEKGKDLLSEEWTFSI